MLGEAHRLERLVSDLLDLARLRAEHPRLDLARTDLVELVHQVEAVWSRRCAKVGIPFALVAQPTQAWATTDPARVRQLVDGLLENAVRVTPGGRPIVVELRSATPRERGWVLEVRDGGPGLTGDDITVAFEPSALHQRYRGIRPAGTGLGLAIVKRLADLLGGSVEAGHAPEGGARFTLRLPGEGPGVSPGPGGR